MKDLITRGGSYSSKRLEAVRMVGFVLLIAAVLFRIQHWPGADLLIVTAWLLALGAMVWRSIVERPITSTIFLRDLFRLSLISLVLLHFLHLPGQELMVYVLLAYGAGLLWIDRRRLLPRHGEKPLLFYSALASIALGGLFRILHWPYSTPMLLLGLALAGLWFFTSWGERKDA
ncbi:MAG TPA: hypothetical protein VGE21_07590 [Flavobacteriales bacterium]